MIAYEKIRAGLSLFATQDDRIDAKDALDELERAAAEPAVFRYEFLSHSGWHASYIETRPHDAPYVRNITQLYAAPPASVAEIREVVVTYDVASSLGRALGCAPEFARGVVRAVQRELGPTLGLVELKEPTAEECERIYSFWIGAEGCNGRTPGERMGRIMFDACRAVLWPKSEEK